MAAKGKSSPRLGTGGGSATEISTQTVSDALRACLARKDQRGAALVLVAATTGLRAFQLANLTWDQVLDDSGTTVGSTLRVPFQKTKGKHSSRTLPLPKKAATALQVLLQDRQVAGSDPVFVSQRTRKAMTAQAVVDWFRRLFRSLGVKASAHSVRRYFITMAARSLSQARGSSKDLMYLAQHSSYSTTARYIDKDPQAQEEMARLVASQIRI